MAVAVNLDADGNMATGRGGAMRSHHEQHDTVDICWAERVVKRGGLYDDALEFSTTISNPTTGMMHRHHVLHLQDAAYNKRTGKVTLARSIKCEIRQLLHAAEDPCKAVLSYPDAKKRTDAMKNMINCVMAQEARRARDIGHNRAASGTIKRTDAFYLDGLYGLTSHALLHQAGFPAAHLHVANDSCSVVRALKDRFPELDVYLGTALDRLLSADKRGHLRHADKTPKCTHIRPAMFPLSFIWIDAMSHWDTTSNGRESVAETIEHALSLIAPFCFVAFTVSARGQSGGVTTYSRTCQQTFKCLARAKAIHAILAVSFKYGNMVTLGFRCSRRMK